MKKYRVILEGYEYEWNDGEITYTICIEVSENNEVREYEVAHTIVYVGNEMEISIDYELLKQILG